MKKLNHILLTLFLLLGFAPAVSANTYTIDTVHSTIGFSVKHLTVTDVVGNFKTFNGTITYDPANAAATSMEATIETKSIYTQNEGRDNHLRNADFFDAENNPAITFKSKTVNLTDSKGNVTGDLTIKGVTKEITIPVSLSGPVKHPMTGSDVIGLNGSTTINRQDFGIKWNKQLDQGGLLIGDDVVININIEAAKK